MRDVARAILLQGSKALYYAIRPILFKSPAQKTHEQTLRLMAWLDAHPVTNYILAAVNRIAFKPCPVTVGGVTLPYPFILAAGLVKGHGFLDEETACAAVRRGEDIIPGWRSIPACLGPVEFGSFTRWPRLGNPGTVVWRHTGSHSTQNRIGLKNPGALAAAAFLAHHRAHLPLIFGINIALSPGLAQIAQEVEEAVGAVNMFTAQGIYPSWFTLNLSCPNTEDDPGDHQTEIKTRDLCAALIGAIRQTGRDIPLWVKVGPELADSQYATLMRVFHDTGVRAVIATNTLPRIAPSDPSLIAGVGGGRLHAAALHAARILMEARREHGYGVDVVGCGGVEDPASYLNFKRLGVNAVQYWSALVYRGPLAAALILNEAEIE